MSGGALRRFVERSRHLRAAGAAWPARPQRAVIVGATCAGKTTVARAIREAAGDAPVQLPLRFTTRPPRGNDCLQENRFVSEREFDRLLESGEVAVHWRRALEAGREVRYGFAPAGPGRFAVYSGNNALVAAAPDLLCGALLVLICAPDAVRSARLHRRSPDLLAAHPAEADRRLADSSAPLLPRCHVVVENHGAGECDAPDEVARLIALAAAGAPAVPEPRA